MLQSFALEPVDIHVEEVIEVGRAADSDMAVAQAELPTGFGEADVGPQQQSHGGGDARAVGAAPAMKKNRVFGAVEDFDKPADLVRRRHPPGGEANIFQTQVVFL